MLREPVDDAALRAAASQTCLEGKVVVDGKIQTYMRWVSHAAVAALLLLHVTKTDCYGITFGHLEVEHFCPRRSSCTATMPSCSAPHLDKICMSAAV